MTNRPKTKLHRLLHQREMKVKDLERALLDVGEKIEYYQLTEIRNGKRTNFTTETLYKLCKALDCTPNDILDWNEKPQPKKRKSSPKNEEEWKLADNKDELADDYQEDADEQKNIDQEVRKYEDVVHAFEQREEAIRQEYRDVEKQLGTDSEIEDEEDEDFGF